MNIRKFLNKIILVSAAFFWAGCSGDSVTKVASGNEDATTHSDTSTTDSGSSTIGDKSSSSTNVESSSSNSWKYPGCMPTDFESPIDYRDETYKKDPKEPAEKSANREAQIAIRDSIEDRYSPDQIFYDDEGNPGGQPYCLFKMLDTLAQPSGILYGALPNQDGQIIKSVHCSDGTTQVTEEYLNYKEDLIAHEEEVKAYKEQKAAYTEAYDKYFEEYFSKRTAELISLLDSCVNHPGDFKKPEEDEYEDEDFDEDIDEDVDEEEDSSSSKKADSSSSKEEKPSSSSKKNSGGDFQGEFAKSGL